MTDIMISMALSVFQRLRLSASNGSGELSLVGADGGSMQVRLLQDDACVSVQPVASVCHLPDGFHTLPWTAVNLAQLAPAWDHLARHAASPNSFFESWYLTPSLEAFDPRGDVSLAMLVEGGELRGSMPSWADPNYQGRPLVHIAPWLHANMFCGTPLVSKGWE
ncbi:hypothetical protein [Erythrobacter mangrovi]|uniref:GNAT family N-acetyltransferase n=1 Tax=Erythrobacter mangrovi TaxID=2739433 RepID=A0A7D4B9F4_9SPHN|nr:hypothetical protein [Erythrobacter mangrovi]QKG69966.1 hypothetical protein HQR01_00470 [Erythrobacter mangrovi]